MRRFAIALTFLASAVAAQPTPVGPGSEISYQGSALLHDWVGTSTAVAGALDLDLDRPERSTVRLTVPVASFDSGNGARDRKMREATEADRFPTVTFVSTSVVPERWDGAPGRRSGRWTVRGGLTFHGVTRPVVARVDVVERGGAVTASPAFDVDMTDFGVERPGLGPAKVADRLRFRGTITTVRPGGA